MRVGQIIRVDVPLSSSHEKVESITVTALEVEKNNHISSAGELSEDARYIEAAKRILRRRMPEFLTLLSIYRRTHRVYECHIQYAENSVSTAMSADVTQGMTLEIRSSDRTPIPVQGPVRITVNGRHLRPNLDFTRHENLITLTQIPHENSEIDIDFRSGGSDMSLRGWLRGLRFVPEDPDHARMRTAHTMPNRILGVDGTLCVNGQRVGEVAGLNVNQALQHRESLRERIIGPAMASFNVTNALRLIPVEMRRLIRISYEYLFQYNSALNPSDADEMGAAIANMLRITDSHFVALLSFTPIAEDFILDIVYQVDSADAPTILELRSIGGVAANPTSEPPPLPDSRIAIPKENRDNRITLDDEEFGFRRPDRSDIMD
jgi:hypothetical protein